MPTLRYSKASQKDGRVFFYHLARMFPRCFDNLREEIEMRCVYTDEFVCQGCLTRLRFEDHVARIRFRGKHTFLGGDKMRGHCHLACKISSVCSRGVLQFDVVRPDPE